MKRSPNPALAMPPEFLTYFGLIQGQGAAAPIVPAPPTIPRFGSFSSIKGVMTSANNYVLSTGITRVSAGVYTVVFKDGMPEILDIDTNIWGVDGKQIQLQDYNPQTLTLSFSTYSATGTAATDLATTDFVRFTFSGQFSVYP